MRKIRVGINGFGRIGRNASRILLDRNDIELAAINSKADVTSHAYLLQYDSTYGIFPHEVNTQQGMLCVDNKKISVFSSDDPASIPWGDANVDLVIDATGKFRTSEELEKHIKNSVKHVVLSAPAKDSTKTIVVGVNHSSFNLHKDFIVSNSSCTTNCLSTTIKVLDDSLGVIHGFMTTTHAVTDSQNLLDNSHKKEVRLRRAAFSSIIPSSTGSAKDIGKLFPHLSGKIICQAMRIPLPTVSLINLTVFVKKQTTKEEVNKLYQEASNAYLNGILDVTKDELVSKDFTGNTHSSIVDTYLTQVIDGNYINIYAWYDNEWGYTSRLIDLVAYIGKQK